MSKAVGSHMRWWCSLTRLKMSEQVKLHFTYHNFLLFWMCCKKKQWIQKLVQHIRADLKTRKHYVKNFSFTDKLFLNPASFNVEKHSKTLTHWFTPKLYPMGSSSLELYVMNHIILNCHGWLWNLTCAGGNDFSNNNWMCLILSNKPEKKRKKPGKNRKKSKESPDFRFPEVASLQKYFVEYTMFLSQLWYPTFKWTFS